MNEWPLKVHPSVSLRNPLMLLRLLWPLPSLDASQILVITQAPTFDGLMTISLSLARF